MTSGDRDVHFDGVRILDEDVPRRVRHPRDLLAIVLCLLGIVVVLVVAVYAHGTTSGIANDVQEVSTIISWLLGIPLRAIEILVMLGVPLAVLTELVMRKALRQAAVAVVASVTGAILAFVTSWLIDTFATNAMQVGLSIWVAGERFVTIPTYVAAIVALLTMAGPRTRRRTVRWSWNALWIASALILIAGQVSIPGVVLALVIGRTAGLAVRYLAGVDSERAYGLKLIEALRAAGFEPVALARVRGVSDQPLHETVTPAAGIDTVPATTADVSSGDESFRAPTTSMIRQTATDPASMAIARQLTHRVYALTTHDGPRLDVVVLDGDRQVLGFLSRLWQSIRLRGIEGRSSASLRAVAERAALTAYAADAAGVRTPRLRGIAAAADSMLLIQEHAGGAVPWRDLPDEAVTDGLLAELWRQITRAHAHGLAHGEVTENAVLVDRSDTDDNARPKVWITSWESGVVASSEFSRRMDLAQLMALIALRVGPERAVRSAQLAGVEAKSIGPLIQAPALPAVTREQVRADKDLLKRLREELSSQLPDADVAPIPLGRFSARRIVMSALTVVAIVVIATSIGFDDIREAVQSANPWWMVIAFGLGLSTWVGSATTLVAFSPVRLPFGRSFLVQAASSFVALAAPAGIGPAALNYRLLATNGVATSLAVATVTLVQVSQVVVTVLLLVAISILTGDLGMLRTFPSTTVLVVLSSIAAVVLILMLVPKVRRWLLARLTPIFQQIWPRLSEVISQPGRLALGIGGGVMMTLGFVLAFDASLAAFGQEVSLLNVAIVYLVGNAVGAAVPTPGGVGAVEFALITGLTTTAGVSASVAASAVMLFRLMTYWGRIPLGWIAMQRLQRTGDI